MSGREPLDGGETLPAGSTTTIVTSVSPSWTGLGWILQSPFSSTTTVMVSPVLPSEITTVEPGSALPEICSSSLLFITAASGEEVSVNSSVRLPLLPALSVTVTVTVPFGCEVGASTYQLPSLSVWVVIWVPSGS